MNDCYYGMNNLNLKDIMMSDYNFKNYIKMDSKFATIGSSLEHTLATAQIISTKDLEQRLRDSQSIIE